MLKPSVSIRTLESHLGVPKPSVYEMLKKYRYYIYHLEVHRALTNEDHNDSDMIQQYGPFLLQVFCTDEKTSTNNDGARIMNIIGRKTIHTGSNIVIVSIAGAKLIKK